MEKNNNSNDSKEIKLINENHFLSLNVNLPIYPYSILLSLRVKKKYEK